MDGGVVVNPDAETKKAQALRNFTTLLIAFPGMLLVSFLLRHHSDSEWFSGVSAFVGVDLVISAAYYFFPVRCPRLLARDSQHILKVELLQRVVIILGVAYLIFSYSFVMIAHADTAMQELLKNIFIVVVGLWALLAVYTRLRTKGRIFLA